MPYAITTETAQARVTIAVATLLIGALSGASDVSAQDDLAIPRLIEPDVREATIEGPVRFLTTADFAPFNAIGPGGQAVGFNVDLARSLCEARDLVCSIQIVPWRQITARLQNGLADAAIAGHGAGFDAPGLHETAPYLGNPGRFVVRRTDGLDLAARLGAVVGPARDFLGDHDVAAAAFDTVDEAFAALERVEVDAVFAPAITAARWLEAEGADCCALAPGVYHDPATFGEGMVILTVSEELANGLTAGLDDLHETGRFAELYLRHFPNGLY